MRSDLTLSNHGVLVAVSPGGMALTVAGIALPIRLVRQVRRAAPVDVLLVFADPAEAVRHAALAAREGTRAVSAGEIPLWTHDRWLGLRGDVVLAGDAVRDALQHPPGADDSEIIGPWLNEHAARDWLQRATGDRRESPTSSPEGFAVKRGDLLGVVANQTTARRLEHVLLRTLGRPQDPNVTRLTGRRFSTPVSLRLARAGVRANTVTILGILFGTAAAVLIATGGYWPTLLGSLILVASRLLDDCDGEVARLTITQSHAGERLDIASDIIVHTGAFLALAINALRSDPDGAHLWAFALLVVGGAISTVLILRFVTGTDLPERSRLLRTMETSASGDFAYVVLLFALVGGTPWFLWLAAIGAQFFWLILGAVILRHTRPAPRLSILTARLSSRHLEWALLATGLYVLFTLVRKVGPAQLLQDVAQIGWGFVLICLVEGVPFLAATLAWRATLTGRISFSHLFAARLVGDSVNHLTPTATLGGEVLRAQLVTPHLGRAESAASVSLAKFAETAGQIVFILVGLLVVMDETHLVEINRVWLLAGLGVCGLGLVALARLLDRGLFSTAAALFGRARVARSSLARWTPAITAIDAHIRQGIRQRPAGLIRSILWFAFAFAVSTIEVWLVMYFLTVPISWSTAVGIEVLSVIVDGVFFFMPGKLGTQEGGKMLAFTLFGLPPEKGLAMGLIRRGRELFWDSIGLAVYAVLRGRRGTTATVFAETSPQQSAGQE